MPPPHPFLLQILHHPQNMMIVDQLPFLPSFDQVQAGQPLSTEELRLFRNGVLRTIQLYRERHAARVQLSKLYQRSKVEKWVHRFAPLAPDLIQALLPFVKTTCFSFGWSYAELWRLSDTPGARSIHMVKMFCFSYDRWVMVEPALAKLESHMKSRCITLPSREIPGDAFTSHKPSWDVECINSCPDRTRAKLMKKALIRKAFVLPLRGDVPGILSHALVFYGQSPQGYSRMGPRRFVEFSARYIMECFNKLEDIGEEDSDELMEEAEEREQAEKRSQAHKRKQAEMMRGQIEQGNMFTRCLEPGNGPLRLRLRRSQSHMHNLSGADREL